LKRSDVHHVYAMPNGWWASLANGGLMKYEETSNKWVKAGMFVPDQTIAVSQTASSSAKGKKPVPATRKPLAKKAAPQQLAFQVNELTYGGNSWFAATTGGVLVSTDKGATWKSVANDSLVKVPAQSLDVSLDGSKSGPFRRKICCIRPMPARTGTPKKLSFASAGNLHLRRMDDQNLLITSNMGLYSSHDAGRNWSRADVRDCNFKMQPARAMLASRPCRSADCSLPSTPENRGRK